MIRHKRFIVATFGAAMALVGCSDRQSSTPTGPAIPAAASRNQSGGSGSSQESSSRSGPLHVTKDCAAYTRLAGGFCTITSSNVKEIKVGSKVVYANAAGATGLDTDMILDPPGAGNGMASGHVTLDFAAGTGIVTFSGGTGKFNGFSATILVKHLTGTSWAWDGTYSFDGKGEHCDDN